MEPLQILTSRLKELAVGAIEMAPQIAVAIILLFFIWLLDKLVSWFFGKTMRRTRMRPALVDVLNKLVSVALWLTGILLAATLVFPTLTPAKLLAVVGLGSIAIGLAFKDIFENFLAGLLILFRDPMRIGDFIEVEGVEGAVTRITLRDTYVRCTDGQLVILPNAILFKNPVHVRTDQPKRRAIVMAGVAYGEDVDEARAVIEKAVRSVDSVDQTHPVQVFAHGFGASSIDFEVAWWTGSEPSDIRRSRDQVVAAIKRALDDAGIEIPFPYRTLTFKEPLEVARQEKGRSAAE